MENAERQSGAPEWLVLIGASVFILVLAVSAFFEADIRWLHFVQAWMYIVTIALSSSGQPLGIFRRDFRCRLLGLCQCFCNHLLLQRARRAISLGPYRTSGAPGSFIAVPAWFSNLLVIIGCAWAYSRKPTKPRSDIIRVLVSFTLTTLFFAADMALFQPRYLGIFRRLLHPHLPWGVR